MESDFNLLAQLQETYQNALRATINAIPRIVAGIILLGLALLAAKLVEKVLRAALVRARFDSLIERAGIDKSLQKIGLRESLNSVIPRIVYWLLLLLFTQTAAEGLGLDGLAGAIRAFMTYVPNIVAAVLLLVIGSTAGQYAGGAVARAARESGIDFAASLGNIVSALILFVVGIMALAQLKINTDIIRIVTMCSLSGIALAFGLSFGLGTRDITRNIIAGFYARKTFRVGEEIEVRGERGVLRAITPTQTLLDRNGETIAVSNAAFLDEVVKQ